jgi:hypothetical protein
MPRRSVRTRLKNLDAGNYIALAGLIIALGGVAWQATAFIQGARPSYTAPNSIGFRPFATRSDTHQLVLGITASNLDYINGGAQGYDALVSNIAVTLQIGKGKQFKMDWWWFMKGEDDHDQAGPFVVPGKGAVSKEVRFSPRLRPCKDPLSCTDQEAYADFLPWSDFASLLAAKDMSPFITLTFETRYLVPSTLTQAHTCRVTIPDAIRVDFAQRGEKVEYKSLPCIESDEQ